MRPRKRRAQRPILQPHHMPLKHGIHRQLVALCRKQAVRRLVRPVDRQRRRVRDEPVLERVVLVVADELVAHLGPGQEIQPGGMRREELRRPRRHPLGYALVVVARRLDLPAQDEEHHVQHCDLLRQRGDVREVAQDVDDDLRHWVACLFRVQQGRDAGVGRASEVSAGGPFGGFALARLDEVQEDAVEWAGGWDIAAWCCPGGDWLVWVGL